jgi:hypothetical protein
MAKVKLTPLVEQVHGQLGDLVFRRTRNGGTSLIRKADMSKVKWSPAQSAHRQRFRKAIAYARSAMNDPQLKSKYEKAAAKNGKRAFEMAVSDFFQNRGNEGNG